MIAAKKLLTQLEKRRLQLRMSKSAVARRAGVSLPTVNRILSGSESRGSLESVQAIAAALGVQVVLGARSSVNSVVDSVSFREARAREKATRLVEMVQGTMALESQAIDSGVYEQMVRETVHELMAGADRNLWDD